MLSHDPGLSWSGGQQFSVVGGFILAEACAVLQLAQVAGGDSLVSALSAIDRLDEALDDVQVLHFDQSGDGRDGVIRRNRDRSERDG